MKNTIGMVLAMTAALWCWAGMSGAVHAQSSGNMLFYTGTTMEHQGTNWAYLIWQATDEAVLDDRIMAVFQKPGAPVAAVDYSLAGMAVIQEDPSAIQILLDRSVNLGEDLFALNDTIDELFEGIVPSPDLPLRDKVSAVIRGARQSPDLLNNLIFLSKTHPAMALCAGRGFAVEIPAGKSTFEIREYDLTSGRAEDVLGRVTVTAGSPVVLPAPTGVVEVADGSPKGDRNVRLRWGQPPELLRLSLLSFGFNVYRIPKDWAEEYGFNTTPPSPSELVPPYFTRVNKVPILPNDEDTDNAFFVDDNDRFAPGGAALTNGDAFYYFVTARDILGRDGLVSAGLPVTVCDRMPPEIPSRLSVVPVYSYSGSSTQIGFQISWRQNEDSAEDRTVGYYVYRAPSIPTLQAGASNPAAHLISGLIPHVPGQLRASFTDTNLPPVTNTATFWYTVRAMDDGACSANYSGQGAPAAGAVHDWSAAPAPTGVTVRLIGELATVTFSNEQSMDCTNAPALCNYFNLRCHLPVVPSSMDWVEFRWIAGSSTNASEAAPVGPRQYFAEGQSLIECPFLEYGRGVTFFCRVGTKNGTVSEWKHHVAEAPVKSSYSQITFDAHVIYTALTPDDPTVQIVPEDGPTGADWDWPTLVFTLPDGVEEWRIYRRVDGGDLTLIEQGLSGTGAVTEVVAEDKGAGIAYGATLCYYLQYFDVSGNPGPMTLIECIDVQGNLPKPTLVSLTSSGTAVEPEMEMEWFCAPEGVERFHIWIAAGPDALADLSVDYCTRLEGTNVYPAVFPDGTTNTLNFAVFQTGRVGVNFGSASNPVFTANANIRPGEEYTVFVRAVGVGNGQSDDSGVLQFSWYAPTEKGPEVPWPVRGPVHVQTEPYGSGFGAVLLDYPTVTVINEDRVGIRVGEFSGRIVGKPGSETTIYFLDDLMDYVFTNAHPGVSGETMFPFVIYRRQVTNSLYSTVSGDLYQVSPLLETIYYEPNPSATNLVVYDPYFVFVADDPYEETEIGIYVLDTQPATRGAAYEYLLMRYNDQHEVDRIIPGGTVEIPE